jgi:hypothetical protein
LHLFEGLDVVEFEMEVSATPPPPCYRKHLNISGASKFLLGVSGLRGRYRNQS